MEESEPRQDRKRPRLDSGPSSTAAADDDDALTDSGCPEQQNTVPSPSAIPHPSDPISSSPTDHIAPHDPLPPKTSSMVTINTRPSSSAAPKTLPPEPVPPDSLGSPPTTSSSPEVQQQAPDGGSVPVLSSPSSTQSPEIQVAEPQDFDEDPTLTRWRPSNHTSHSRESSVEIDTRYVFETYPEARFYEQHKTEEVLVEFMKDFRFGSSNLRLSNPLESVNGWLQQFLADCDTFPEAVMIDDGRFWAEFPRVLLSLLNRGPEASAKIDEALLESFFVNFCRLSGLILDFDAVTTGSTSASPNIPLLLSTPYVQALFEIFNVRSTSIYYLLRDQNDVEPAAFMAIIVRQFVEPPCDLVHRLHTQAQAIAIDLQKKAVLAVYYADLLRMVNRLIWIIYDSRESQELSRGNASIMQHSCKQAFDFCHAYVEVLRLSISKQWSWLTSEAFTDMVGLLCSSFQYILLLDPRLSTALTMDDSTSPVEMGMDSSDMALLLAHDWKLNFCWKAVTTGRMELRAQGMELIQSTLVWIYNEFIRGYDAPSSPLVQRVVDWIRQTKILHYLFGADSHPQLISRSGNLIAFLAVSKAYTEDDTDIIWNCVLENRDSRMVGEMLPPLMTLLEHLDAPAVGYIFTKLFDVPVARFDSKLIAFCTRLLTLLDRNWQTHKQYISDVLQVRLFVKLLRLDSASADMPSENHAPLQTFAYDHLVRLSEAVVSEPDMTDILRECVADVKQSNSSSGGSIRALHALISHDSKSMLLKLTAQFDYIRTFIEALTQDLESYPEHYADSTFLQNDFVCRIRSLAEIIHFVPEKIAEDLADGLWNNLYASGELGTVPKNYAWDTLSSITEKSSGRNDFIDVFLSTYFPRLDPDDYNPSILHLVASSMDYELSHSESKLDSKDSILSIAALERVWRLILKAKSGTIETDAINVLIKFCIESSAVLKCEADVIKDVHISIVDRCIRQIIDSATTLKSFSEGTTSGDDEPMVLIASESEIRNEELRFSRSLLLLRKFLNALKSSPRFSPPPMSGPIPETPVDSKGESIIVKFQAFDGSRNPEMKTLSVGELNTAHELALLLRQKTGMQRFTGIVRGVQIDLFGNHSTLKVLGIGPLGGLLVVKRPADASRKQHEGRRNSLTHVDCEIVRNFNDFYTLLDSDQHLAAEIFNFLQVFPIQKQVDDMIRRMDTRVDDVLPLDKPYKLLYSANVIFLGLEDESLSSTPDIAFVQHCVHMLVTTCEAHAECDMTQAIQISIAANLVDCLLLALRVKVPAEISKTYFPNKSGLLRHLIKVIHTSSGHPVHSYLGPASRPLASQAFAVLINASMHDSQVWTDLEQEAEPTLILSDLLLRGNNDVRKGIADVLLGLSGPPSHKIHFKPHSASALRLRFSKESVQEFVLRLWPKLLALLPEMTRTATTAQEAFDVIIAFHRLSEPSTNIESFILKCQELLSEYVPIQIVGRQNEDYVLSGLIKLLFQSIEILKTSGRTVEQEPLLDLLLHKYLFPEPSTESLDINISPKYPTMKSSIRQDLYALVHTLYTSQGSLNLVLDSIQDLYERETWEAPFQNERFPLRSEVGHAGLRNLSNTCYLNSLFSQLYMNLEFRDFLFSVEAADHVVGRLQELYAQMQNSCLRAIDTSAVVNSIRTYDNEAIDIAIQMDVDEFYNLLFDRLEAQLPSPKAKSSFRSIYGGQLVQQIKSKECEHISERLEPFSAIQCEIRDKNSLEESLKAYVEGEVMQGDNKYSCTSCNRHVDAVKRACLKHVPDHLIFHLKRFDFDINTMTRCKINDEFAFPHSIDMAPYTLDSLSEDGNSVEPDMFELVGVLIHSGTAESGHYYSLIRERPTGKDSKDSWIQFNDSEVTFFDQNRLREYCFGGVDSSTFRTMKVWNAYMLFYQRVSSIEKFKDRYSISELNQPVQLQVPTYLGNQITLRNEQYLQAFCAQDPAHARFMLSLLESINHLKGEAVSEDHQLESKAILQTLQYVEQVSSRFKELPDVEKSIRLITQHATDCADCANIVLTYFFTYPDSFKAAVLRNPQADVRSSFATLIWLSLTSLRDAATNRSSPSAEASRRSKRYRKVVQHILEVMNDFWFDLHLLTRGWNEYFGLMANLATLGESVTQKILADGYLFRCLSLVCLNIEDDPLKMAHQYQGVWRLKRKGRKLSYYGIMDLLARLLNYVDLDTQQTDDLDRSRLPRGPGLNRTEWRLFKPTTGESKLVTFLWLYQCLLDGYNVDATMSIVQTLSSSKYVSQLFNTIKEGLDADPASLARPFLHATLILAECSEDKQKVCHLVNTGLLAVETLGNTAGADHVNFIRQVTTLENPSIGMMGGEFRDLLINLIHRWAPDLLMYHEHPVRAEAVALVHDLVLTPLEEIVGSDPVDETWMTNLTSHAQDLAKALHLKINQMARERNFVGMGKQGRMSKSVVLETLQVLRSIHQIIAHEEDEMWQEIQETAAWLQTLVEGAESDESEASDGDLQNPSDSDDWAGNVSTYDEMTP